MNSQKPLKNLKSLFVSPELLEHIQLELKLIIKEIALLEILLKKAQSYEIDEIDCRAAASCLHSTYSGYEKIFLMIAKDKGVSLKSDQRWHKNLLDQVASLLFDEKQLEQLNKLLGFRHFFRHAYSFSLKWENMEPLIKMLLNEVHSDFCKKFDS